jgi:hypothetical protein
MTTSYPAPTPALPTPPDRYDAAYFARVSNTINRLQSSAVLREIAVSSVLLQSPDGSVYKVEVDNSGNLTTTAVPLGQQGSPPY